MNKCWVEGRIATDPEFRTTQSGIAQCSFRLASQRKYKNAAGEKITDFFPVVAWRQNANFIHKFFHKGDLIFAWGEMQTRSYTAQDGTPRHITEIIVDEIKGWGNGQKLAQDAPESASPSEGDFMPVDDDEPLPF